MEALRIKPDATFLVGDTVTDVEACLLADVVDIGYSENESRHVSLRRAGAAVVIDSMGDLL
jgi:phosphoglycolate phosphatase-like HAD superfamily hydrolase